MNRFILLCMAGLLLAAGCVGPSPGSNQTANTTPGQGWVPTGPAVPVGVTLAEAISIAKNTKECMDVGVLEGTSTYNPNSKTWWLDLDADKPGCAPACVVYDNRSAAVNWRCTGLIPPEKMTEAEARAIAEMTTECTGVGSIAAGGTYNDNSETWWFDLNATMPGCVPACVVHENASAEVNYRCTGLLPTGNKTLCSKPCHLYVGTVDYSAEPPACVSGDEPLVCTMEYRTGDLCLKYITCDAVGDNCTTAIDPMFYECVECFKAATSTEDNQLCETAYQE